jgi:hypothetical protein
MSTPSPQTVRLLTFEQALQLGGNTWATDSYFEPQKDGDDNWILSEEEATGNTNPQFDWVKDLPQIEFKPRPFVL